jgi:hypothetical protein
VVRRWARWIALLVGVTLLGLVSVPLATVLPLLRDDWALDRIVVAVALDWRDFGEDKARQRLQYELDHAGIGGQVSDEACTFGAEPDDVRAIACRWGVSVDLPLVTRRIPLAFESVARIDRRGGLLR